MKLPSVRRAPLGFIKVKGKLKGGECLRASMLRTWSASPEVSTCHNFNIVTLQMVESGRADSCLEWGPRMWLSSARDGSWMPGKAARTMARRAPRWGKAKSRVLGNTGNTKGAVSKHISSHNRFSARADPPGWGCGSWFAHSGGAVLYSI
jgi:hypothetical protein